MPLPNCDDVADGILNRWAGVVVLIPVERVYAGVIGETTVWPNARIMVAEDTKERNSGSLMLAKYRVTVECYLLGSDLARDLRQQLDTAFEGTGTLANPGITVANSNVIWSRGQAGGSTMPTDQKQNGQVIVKLTAIYLLLLQGAR